VALEMVESIENKEEKFKWLKKIKSLLVEEKSMIVFPSRWYV